jgi:hypothetical protein
MAACICQRVEDNAFHLSTHCQRILTSSNKVARGVTHGLILRDYFSWIAVCLTVMTRLQRVR